MSGRAVACIQFFDLTHRRSTDVGRAVAIDFLRLLFGWLFFFCSVPRRLFPVKWGTHKKIQIKQKQKQSYRNISNQHNAYKYDEKCICMLLLTSLLTLSLFLLARFFLYKLPTWNMKKTCDIYADTLHIRSNTLYSVSTHTQQLSRMLILLKLVCICIIYVHI